MLKNKNGIEHISGEWYRCKDLLFLMRFIDECIKKMYNYPDFNTGIISSKNINQIKMSNFDNIKKKF